MKNPMRKKAPGAKTIRPLGMYQPPSVTGLKTVTLAPGQDYSLDILANPTVARRVTDVLTVAADDPQATTYTLTLAADGYALVANQQAYTFTDHSGDIVTVSAGGQAQAGPAGGPAAPGTASRRRSADCQPSCGRGSRPWTTK